MVGICTNQKLAWIVPVIYFSPGEPMAFQLKSFMALMEHGVVDWDILDQDFTKRVYIRITDILVLIFLDSLSLSMRQEEKIKILTILYYVLTYHL